MTLALSCRRVGQALTSDVLHLSRVNPYIAATLQRRGPAGPDLAAHLPRQRSGAPAAGGSAIAGISGFAFQGTNAHVILGRCPTNLWILSPSWCHPQQLR